MRNDNSAANPGVEYATIAEDVSGQRVDNFLSTRLKGVPKSRVYRMLRKGEVRVNKGRVRPSYRLRAGDVVRIPPVRRAGPDPASAPAAATREYLAGRVLHEDERLLVLDKPAGMAVHGGSGLSFGVIEALRATRPDCRYLELVHRLDRDTSGCLLVARKRSYLRALHALLRQGGLEKRYLALVCGDWQQGTVRLEDRLERRQDASGERSVRVSDAGKRAASRFSPVQRYRGATLMEVELFTGRTHQIRVQAAEAGHPLAGDGKYGDPGCNARMAAAGLRRMFLHAHSLGYDDPVTGVPRAFSAPLPEDLRTVLDALGVARG